MFRLMFFMIGISSLCFGKHVSSPEEQVLLIEDFLSEEVANFLSELHRNRKPVLDKQGDNQLALSEIREDGARFVLAEIAERIRVLLEREYGEMKGTLHVDHLGLYARIAGNFCPYHADNGYFACPIHGTDQRYLRKHCPGDCSGSRFLPNHTSWREYTALVYLNEDFSGGELVFEDGPCNRIYRKVLPIRKGMLVLAPNGADFYHEVLPIRRGTRYSLHIWYTKDSRHRADLPKGPFSHP